ncbi:hypothetical protein, partial [Tetragenococcus koreensis]|uniref:hypothetical protein n=1 Tax=Tetragenococcus koreensis TaxID=290335 RepID=UPI001F3B09D7
LDVSEEKTRLSPRKTTRGVTLAIIKKHGVFLPVSFVRSFLKKDCSRKKENVYFSLLNGKKRGFSSFYFFFYLFYEKNEAAQKILYK